MYNTLLSATLAALLSVSPLPYAFEAGIQTPIFGSTEQSTANKGALGSKENGSTQVPDPQGSILLDISKSEVRLVPKVKTVFFSDLVYAESKTTRGEPLDLKMDLLIAETNRKLPCVVYITGGAFETAPKANNWENRVRIAEAGYVVASIEYHTVHNGLFGHAIADVKEAVRYLRSNADLYGIDEQRIALWGESAGGYLAAMVGTTNGTQKFISGDYLDASSDVQAVVDVFGLTDLTQMQLYYEREIDKKDKTAGWYRSGLINVDRFVHGSSGLSIHSSAETAAQANPITYVDAQDPPFLILHGTEDNSVAPRQTEILHKALCTAGVSSTRYLLKGAGHGGEAWSHPEVLQTIIGFLDKQLKGEESKKG